MNHQTEIQNANLILPSGTEMTDIQGRQRFLGRPVPNQSLVNLVPDQGAAHDQGLERFECEVLIGEDGNSCLLKLEMQADSIPLRIVWEEDRLARLPFSDEQRLRLSQAKVVSIGCGSLGSAVATMLGRAGVRHQVLCDVAELQPHNLSRHTGTVFDIGRPKPEIVAEQQWRVDPSIEIACINEDIFEWDWELRRGLWSDADVVVATTDKRSVQLCVNEDLVHLAEETFDESKPVGVFAGCFDEARGGEVFVVYPGEEAPCLACLRGGLDGPERVGTMDYSTATSAEDFRGEPGLDAAVHQIASVTAQAVLSVLLRGCPGSELGKLITPEQNYLLIGTALSGGFYRFGHAFQTGLQPLSGKRKDCIVCGTSDSPVLSALVSPWIDLDVDHSESGHRDETLK